MEEVAVVRHRVLVEGASRREVARALGISRNTVLQRSREMTPFRSPKMDPTRITISSPICGAGALAWETPPRTPGACCAAVPRSEHPESRGHGGVAPEGGHFRRAEWGQIPRASKRQGPRREIQAGKVE